MRVENGVVGGGKKEDRVVGGVWGVGAKGGTHHVGNFRHIFVVSLDKESFKKNSRHHITR